MRRIREDMNDADTWMMADGIDRDMPYGMGWDMPDGMGGDMPDGMGRDMPDGMGRDMPDGMAGMKKTMEGKQPMACKDNHNYVEI